MNIRPALFVTVGLLTYYHYTRPRTCSPLAPVPVIPVTVPTAPTKPKPKPRFEETEGNSSVGGPEYQGVSVICDLPAAQHLKNKGGMGRGGPGTGSGLCTFTSLDVAAIWSNYEPLIGFRDYMTKFPGGGDPDKVDQYIAKIAKDRNVPAPVKGVDYGHLTGVTADDLIAIVSTYRIVAVTYGHSPRYVNPSNPRGVVNHMVNLVSIDKDYAAVLDNNFPGTIEWMSTPEFVARCKRFMDERGQVREGRGWAVWLAAPPPPPVPVN